MYTAFSVSRSTLSIGLPRRIVSAISAYHRQFGIPKFAFAMSIDDVGGAWQVVAFQNRNEPVEHSIAQAIAKKLSQP